MHNKNRQQPAKLKAPIQVTTKAQAHRQDSHDHLDKLLDDLVGDDSQHLALDVLRDHGRVHTRVELRGQRARQLGAHDARDLRPPLGQRYMLGQRDLQGLQVGARHDRAEPAEGVRRKRRLVRSLSADERCESEVKGEMVGRTLVRGRR
jgi:hypothetical protein